MCRVQWQHHAIWQRLFSKLFCYLTGPMMEERCDNVTWRCWSKVDRWMQWIFLHEPQLCCCQALNVPYIHRITLDCKAEDCKMKATTKEYNCFYCSLFSCLLFCVFLNMDANTNISFTHLFSNLLHRSRPTNCFCTTWKNWVQLEISCNLEVVEASKSYKMALRWYVLDKHLVFN